MISRSKVILIALAAALIVTIMPASVFAEGSVTYKGESKGFEVGPGSADSETDLFDGFKGMVPGDELKDRVTVKNGSGKKVKIYMRALASDKKSEEFLSQLTLTVKQGERTITDGDASEQKGLGSWQLLGNYGSGKESTLDVTVSAPIEMSDEYQDRTGEIKWQFKAEAPVDKDDDDPAYDDDPEDKDDNGGKDDKDGKDGGSQSKPKTGDSNGLIAFIAIAVSATIALSYVIRKRS